jgi:hypothetical protein
VRNHLFLGSSVRYCLGVDGEIGGTSTGVVYDAELYLAGVAVPLGGGSDVGICAGAGLGGIGGAVPFGWQFPVEAGAEVQAGPVRLVGWAKVAWIAGADARKDGSDVPLGDEFAAGAGIRVGKNTRYWDGVTAGPGVYVGATFSSSWARASSVWWWGLGCGAGGSRHRPGAGFVHWSHHASTVSYHRIEFCGFCTQWFSSGK